MKKKVATPVLALLLLTAGVGFAALVNLLSNTVQVDVQTKTPLEIKFVDAGPNDDSVNVTIVNDSTITVDMYAGSTFYFNYTVTNHANNPIDRYPVVIVSSDKPFSAGLQEIQQIVYYDANYPHGLDITNNTFCVNEVGTLTPLRECNTDETATTVELYFDNDLINDGPQPYTITAGATWWYRIDVVTNPATTGTYTITYEEHFTLP